MRKMRLIFGLLFIAAMAGRLMPQSCPARHLVSLCELQMKVPEGEHRTVRVQGVYLSGLEGQYLVTSGCSGRSTAIEFKLATRRLWKRLVRLSNRTNKEKHVAGNGDPVLVIFEGEFYGPRVPDSRLPDNIRKNYHPGWDHMNASMTKMVVHGIQKAESLPASHPCAPPRADPSQWPCFQNPAPVP